MKRLLAQVLWMLALVGAAVAPSGCQGSSDTADMTEVYRVRSEEVDVVLLSPHEGLRHGNDTLTIEFRSPSDGRLVDVGNVQMSANMPMPGMPMFGTIEVRPTDTPGRYTANCQFEMAGTWRMNIQWDGPAGPGSVGFSGTVQ